MERFIYTSQTFYGQFCDRKNEFRILLRVRSAFINVSSLSEKLMKI